MIKHKLAYIISSAAVLGSAGLFPAFAAQDVVAGNGAFSRNDIREAVQQQETSVRQTNNTDISNNVQSTNDTGHNSADFNTGGTTYIRTGNANSDIRIQNSAGYNQANVSGGGCDSCNSDRNVSITGNGAFSQNAVHFSGNDQKDYNQDNNTRYDNKVKDYNNSGYNNSSSYEQQNQKYNNGGYEFKNDNYGSYTTKEYNKNGYDNKDYGSRYMNNKQNSYENNYSSYNSYNKYNQSYNAYNQKYDNNKYDNRYMSYNNNSYGKNSYSQNNNDCHYFTQQFYQPKQQGYGW